ncbi:MULTISPECIES: hypothetical protein [unclassified Saccharicrinis]|uniref:hypothetical protein n=1 Tax=unclassified Saccharicrinis TaxID=2646859 RepID=UPI003D32DDB0
MKFPKSILFVFFVVISLQITAQQKSKFTISSSGVKPDGSLSIEFTGEGEGVSMPLEWSNVPKGTKCFAINLWHHPHPTDSTEVKSYWVVYNIPANIKRIPKNAKGFGIVGYNDKDQTKYDPMKSKGPGVKEYKLTIYALAEMLEFNNDKVYRADLLKAIEGKVLGKSTLKYTYETGKTGEATQALKGSEESREEKTEVITEAQKEKVKAILSHYNAATLMANDAKAIQEAFREAGLRGGPAAEGTIREAGFNPDKLRDLAPPPDMGKNNQEDKLQEPDQKKYSIEQSISDRAQLTTIGFSGLAFITGDFGASTFLPPGKACDYFGFQYMRDIDAAEKGHNPMFVDRVVGNVLFILNDKQKQLFRDLAEEQVSQLEALAEMRLPLIKSFHMELDGNIPKGSDGLHKQTVMHYVGDIFELDAKLSMRRAEVLAEVANSLTKEQKEYLGKMKFGDFNTWPDKTELAHLDMKKSKLYNVAYMTYASEFFSWYAGSVEADTYICPERQGTYFGGFYMKDIAAMNHRDYDISTSITGDSGEEFLNNVLNETQRGYITQILNDQRKILKEVVDVRREFSTELRKLLNGQQPDKNKLLALGQHYGELDGELSWNYTIAFAKVNKSLTSEQKSELMELRNLDGFESAPYYIYSSPVNKQPVIKNVKLFFKAPK